ncbi:hypothetical protein AALO_G00030940 [Alosa alosa]|uniref:Uncharacterized protein n=1 Tax=Alosa alosa TaxID=278164 RepID=A0AAV6HEA2_9TELE|nr:uncharacterized protein si:ch1073-143l10.2 [Alosa alosa]KAG5284829.1 hypothetical protein AALO_G00030940 [Alosa alosa]
MEKWKSHVRGELFKRDYIQKDPFHGLFVSLSSLEEKVDLRDKLLDGLQGCVERHGCGAYDDLSLKHQLALRESEQDRMKFREQLRDLTAALYLKEAELQYCHAQVVRFRNEALVFGREMATLKTNMADYEYSLELQSKELTSQRWELVALRNELSAVRQEKEELLERWMKEKRLEASRVNKFNQMQERWHRFAEHMGTPTHPEAQQLHPADGEQDLEDEPSVMKS